MKKSNSVLIVIIGIVVVALLWGVGARNSLISMSEEIKAEAAQVGVELQRRSDLIPNAVATVKGLTAHEEGVYTEIVDARTKLSGAIETGDVSKIDAASSELESAFSRLLVIVENYPELKANESFVALQDQLEGTENRIKQARKAYTHFQKNNIIFDHAYSSTSERASDTLEIVTDYKMPYIRLKGLKEWNFGAFEGKGF